ncbi:hypothetical protein Sjap_025323 [Stephania japonica]|uniref:Uncharacterized protein n=1 Tax=Stephania japonica TaxID=461633 RepID=A0AAP0HHF7_9MAGN
MNLIHVSKKCSGRWCSTKNHHEVQFDSVFFFLYTHFIMNKLGNFISVKKIHQQLLYCKLDDSNIKHVTSNVFDLDISMLLIVSLDTLYTPHDHVKGFFLL